MFSKIGQYFILMVRVFKKPEKHKLYYKQLLEEIQKLGLDSIGIIIIISLFIGAVITIQTKLNAENPFFPEYLVGLVTRDSLILEFSSTISALILAGKVGSSIASEIGTMRVTEQIDVLETMGVNSAGYLILPKVIAMVIFNPFLTIISMIVGVSGGFFVALFTDVLGVGSYIIGIQYAVIPFYIFYSLIKSLFFGFFVASIPAYYGYYVEGGSLEVGKSSTRAVVSTIVVILLVNLILTKLLLT